MPVQTGITLDLRRSRHSADDVWSGGTKASALALLGALRDCGLNRDRDIEVHRAETYLWRFWVIGWPDHYNGITHLMTADGRWVPGRLYDASPCWCAIPCRAGHAAPWSRLPGNPGPAAVTHDYRYSAGSVGVLGGDGKPLMSGGILTRPTEVLVWAASAWCIACHWATHDDREETVRSAARYHRERPEEYLGHAIPRRTVADREKFHIQTGEETTREDF